MVLASVVPLHWLFHERLTVTSRCRAASPAITRDHAESGSLQPMCNQQRPGQQCSNARVGALSSSDPGQTHSSWYRCGIGLVSFSGCRVRFSPSGKSGLRPEGRFGRPRKVGDWLGFEHERLLAAPVAWKWARLPWGVTSPDPAGSHRCYGFAVKVEQHNVRVLT